uniref:Indole-3-acetamide (IAM) hydrolase n=1 Tax=Tricholoma vaccinum TaxID=56470 RepID=A0A0C5L3B6_9AGAR|nr:indole-3-acetamide (IAM) hydrolase [Tricholoma vaccinum]
MLFGFFAVLYTLVVNCIFAAAVLEVIEDNASGSILRIGGIVYLAPHFPYATYKPKRSGIPSSPGFTAVTSIRTNLSPITKTHLQQQLTLFSEFDDVYSDRFMDSLFISYDGTGSAVFEADVGSWLESLKIQHLLKPSMSLRSREDHHLALFSLPRPRKEIFSTCTVHIACIKTNTKPSYDSGQQYIPVPSRLSVWTQSLPLTGTRFALKDIYNAQGLVTGAGSLAYARVHGEANTTAPSIQRLLALGATMVGKVRTSQFAHGANPWDFLDIPYCWNPRADGYLTASASSSGSACAIAAYEWLDFTVGSDTRGSVRKPATLVGAYGIRPSHGSMDLTGVLPLSEEMDTAGYFARDPRFFSEIGRLWLVDPLNPLLSYEGSPVKAKGRLSQLPSKLLYPIDHFPVKNPAAQRLFDSFADILHEHLNISKVPINFTDALLPYLPNGNFHEFQLLCDRLGEYRTWKSVGEPLIAKHQELFGSTPSFDIRPRAMFAQGSKLSDEDFAEAVTFKRTFAKSVSEHLIRADDKSCSDSIFMYDAGTGGLPSYRVEDFNSLSGSTPFVLTTTVAGSKASEYFTYIGSMGGLPEITVPIGQVGYYSQVSRHWEVLPVAVQLVAHPGCDEMLFQLVEDLAAAGVLKSVKVGTEAF